MTAATGKYRFSYRYFLLLIIFAIALYVVLPQLGDFRSSWSLLKQPDWSWTIVALIAAATTYLAAASTYYWLAFKPLRYGRTVLIQLAATFVNRLLPAGAGALGVNFLYLRKTHSALQSGTIVAVNNLLGFTGHSLLVVAAMIFGPEVSRSQLTSPEETFSRGLKYGLIVMLAVVLIGLIFSRHRFGRVLKNVKGQLMIYRQRLNRLCLALLSSTALTLTNVACLYACMQAMGVQLPFVVVLLVFTLGVGAGTALPTPGGLGGFEAGLVAGFVAYGVSGGLALAIALLYRFLTYWLPLLVGSVAFIAAERRGYI